LPFARFSIPCILLLIAGCSVSFTTAHITALTVSKGKDSAPAAGAFGPGDSIFARATIANNIGKVTLKWQLVAEKVEGLPEHKALSWADKSFDLEGDGNGIYSLSPPPSGWAAGTYAVSVSMLDDAGAEKDKRSATVTIAGAPAADGHEAAAPEDAVGQPADTDGSGKDHD
jgi:hypothetical protein